MRDPVRIGLLLLLAGALLFGQGASNGIGGGYVGSSRCRKPSAPPPPRP